MGHIETQVPKHAPNRAKTESMDEVAFIRLLTHLEMVEGTSHYLRPFIILLDTM